MNSKKTQLNPINLHLYLVCILSFMTQTTYSQEINFCGVLPFNQAAGSNPDSIYYDRFGNSYDAIPLNNRSAFEEVEYFLLDLNSVPSSLHNTILQVFTDFSSRISQRTLLNSCNEHVPYNYIYIRIDDLSSSSDAIAAGSPFYNTISSDCNIIGNSRIFNKMNGLFIDVFPDGEIRIKTDSLPLNAQWHTDWTTPPAPNTFDLYSVILHELIHLFGFHSFIGLNGHSIHSNNIYSSWDNLIYFAEAYDTSGTSLNTGKLLLNDCTGSCFHFDTSAFPSGIDFHNALKDNCSANGDLDFLIGNSGIAPLNGNQGVLPASDEEVAFALSHLNSSCNGQNKNYVMQPGLALQEARRSVTIDELNILSLLGYDVDTSSVSSCYLVTQERDENLFIPDIGCCNRPYFYNICADDTLTINIQDIICDFIFSNDPGIAFADVYSEEGIASDLNISVSDSQIVILVNSGTPSNFKETLYFTVKACDCSSFYTFKEDLYISNCVTFNDDAECEITQFSYDFEEFIPGIANMAVLYALGDGYFQFTGSPQNSPDICRNDDNNSLRLGIGSHPEAISVKLFKPVYPGCSVDVSFKASASGNLSLNFHFSNFHPCTDINSGATPTDCGEYIYSPLWNTSIPITNLISPSGLCTSDPELETYSFAFVNNTDSVLNYITIFPTSVHNSISAYIDDILVNNVCPIAPCIDFSHDCDSVTFTSCTGGRYSYAWQLGDGTTSDKDSVTHQYIMNGDYNVILTVTDECRNVSASDTIVFSHNCEPVGFTCPCLSGGIDINAGNGTNISGLPLSHNDTLLNTCLAINGTLFIDTDFSVFNGEIRMQPGAQIIVKNEAHFTIKNVNANGGIHGCEQMWKGIYVEPGAALTVLHTQIRDADYGIEVINGASLSVQENRFEDNFIGIYARSVLGYGSVLQPLPLTGNSFSCSTPGCHLLSPYPDRDTTLDTIARSGIKIDYSALTIGSSISGNQFSRIPNAINAHASVVSATNNEFKNMQRALYDESSFITVTKNEFDSCHIGILCQSGQGTYIKDNTLKNVHIGIDDLFRTGYFSAINNTIEYMGFGIRNDRNTLRYPLDIVSNKFSAIEGSGNTGILIIGYPAGEGIKSRIALNQFNLRQQSAGITMHQGNQIAIENNSIRFHSTSAIHGLMFFNSNYNRVYKNSVHHISNQLSTSSRGIVVERSSTNDILCNSTSSSGTLMSFLGVCPATRMEANTMGDTHSSGLLISNTGILGDQYNGCNSWTGTVASTATNAAHAVHLGNPDIQKLSQFFVNTCSPPYWPPSIYPPQICSSDTTKWFVRTSTTSGNCSLTACPDTPVDEDPRERDAITALDSSYLSGYFNTSEYADMFNWSLGKHLYRRLFRNPSLDGQTSLTANFYNTASSQTMGKLAEIEEAMDSLAAVPTALELYWNGLDEKIRQKMLTITEADSLLNLAATQQDSSLLMDLRKISIDSAAILYGLYAFSIDSFSLIRHNLLGKIKARNSAIAPASGEKIAALEKIINTIELETVYSGIAALDENQQEDVWEIALLCPDHFGTVVLRARTLYGLVENIVFNDDSLCNLTPPFKTEKKENALQDIRFTISPNPANDQVLLSWKSERHIAEALQITIVDLYGKTRQRREAPAEDGKALLELSSMLPGIYFVRIEAGGILLSHEKLLIYR